MLKEAPEGRGVSRRGSGYIDLYDLTYTGCRSCLACKRKDAERCRCFWKDDLSPLIDRIFAADALIVGSPIYLGDITSQLRALIERLHFCALSYDDYSNYFTGKVNVGVIFTMNAPQAFYAMAYKNKAKENRRSLPGAPRQQGGGYPAAIPCRLTDYSRFNMAGFNGEHKQAMRENSSPWIWNRPSIWGALQAEENDTLTNAR